MADQECDVWTGMPLEFAPRTDVLNSATVELGAEQLRWLSMFGSIDLALDCPRLGHAAAVGLRGRRATAQRCAGVRAETARARRERVPLLATRQLQWRWSSMAR